MNNKDQQIKELTKQNDDLENYFSNTIIPQLFIDANLILRKFTPPAMKQFNLSTDDVGKSIYDVVNNFRFPSIIENISHVIETNEILEKEIQTTDLRWYQMNILPYVKQVDNKINGVIITFVEITLRIKDLKEQEALIADHETLLDTISHDIKNPLSGLLLTIEMLSNGIAENPKEFKSLLKIAKNAVKKIQSVISELTDARKQEHKYKAVDELLNFENILEDVRLTLLDNIKESHAIIRSELNVSEITFSRRKLRSIIYNLLNNAIKFKSPGCKPEIFIRTSRENHFIILSVKDNGIGIDDTNQKEIFSKYFRIDNNIEGSGIGLHLVKELVTNAGGKILINSQLNKGTEFKIYLKEK
ncbi:MAG TPA: ATP-binding protein [Hanamia sp.]|nr:ATP-binding protein [Hanamia sp.]